MFSSPPFSLACPLLVAFLVLSTATDTLNSNGSLSDYYNETLISANRKFVFGFFTPNGRSKGEAARYVGIWYYGPRNPDPLVIVWVANRDCPILDSPGLVRLADGNLLVIDRKNVAIWSSAPSTTALSSAAAGFCLQLWDSGNLVLSQQYQNGTRTRLWQSFDHPTDTFLPGMRMDQNNVINLTSWRSEDDPRSGAFSFQQDSDSDDQYIIRHQDESDDYLPHWKSGSSGKFISGKFIPDRIPDLILSLLASNFSRIRCSDQDLNNSVLHSFCMDNKPLDVNNTRIQIKFDGRLEFFGLRNQTWEQFWFRPEDNCSIFHACGKFGVCSNQEGTKSSCNCLPGFQSTSPDDWRSGRFSEGCTRISSTCNKKVAGNFSTIRVSKLQRANRRFENVDAKKCSSECISSCCEGYAYTYTQKENYLRDRGSNKSQTCWIWTDDLSNIVQEGNTEADQDLYIRVSESSTEIQNSNQTRRTSEKKMPTFSLLLIGTMAAVVLTACTIFLLCYHRKRRIMRQEVRRITQGDLASRLYDSERCVKAFMDSNEFRENDKKEIEVPSIDLDVIKFATNNFSEENKLGQGGFGPVYKGKFPSGQEIAIKRLSSTTGQGLEEFKNEVVLIAKLQHRNLVRLLGYCVQAYEKLLIYEYMSNKSLDSFIFDRTRCVLLNWETRFNIILGIARGMLYLHQDSRLRIIHRDLKTSNVLLDEEMNPKISDFGLARIFGDKQTEAATNRVVGTYGYMSPEYALDGFFSIKSDVFSFGVVVLEILSGKRSKGFFRAEQGLSLLSHAWRLWKEGKALDLMDQTLRETIDAPAFVRCLHMGLLCVQEDPSDRPNMSTVLFMLGNEIATLPEPKQAAFISVPRSCNSSTSASSSTQTGASSASIAGLTVSVQDGR